MNSRRFAAAVFCFACLLALGRAQTWTQTYNDPSNGDDQAQNIAMDSSGNVYVAGFATGTQLDFVILKYDVAGNLIWSRLWNNSAVNLDDFGRRIAVDGQGNVYVAGETHVSASNQSIAMVKYNSAGTFQWDYIAPISASGLITGALALDGNGQPYLCATVYGSPESFFLAKVDQTTGTAAWLHSYSFGHGDGVSSLAVDGAGNSYLCGSSNNAEGASRGLVMKHSAGGVLSWKYFYTTSPYVSTSFSGITFDSTGAAYAAGSTNTKPFQGTGLLVKLASNGTLDWQYQLTSVGYTSLGVPTLDGSGNCFVTGVYDSRNTNWDATTLKVSPSGQVLRTAQVDLGGSFQDIPQGMVVDKAGRVYEMVTGRAAGGGSQLVKFAYDNNLTLTYMTPISGLSTAGGLVTDGNGRVATCGATLNSNFDIVVTESLEAPYAGGGDFYVNYGHALNVPASAGLLSLGTYTAGATIVVDTGPTPQEGTLTVQPNGAFTFTPQLIKGDLDFTYHLLRNGLSGNEAIISLHITAALAALTLTSSSIKGGLDTTGKVTMNIPGTYLFTPITLTSSDSSVASVPATLYLPYNAQYLTFPIHTNAVATTKQVTITASWNGNMKTAILTVTH